MANQPTPDESKTTEPAGIRTADLAASPEAAREWARDLALNYAASAADLALAERIADSGTDGIPQDRLDAFLRDVNRIARPFLKPFEESVALARMLDGSVNEAETFVLAVNALLEVLVDPIGRMGVALAGDVAPTSPEGRRLQREAATLEAAAEAAGDEELEGRLRDRAQAKRARLRPGKAGAKQARAGDLICTLETWLAEANLPRVKDRHELIADLVGDFLGRRLTAEQVRKTISDTHRRDRRRQSNPEDPALVIYERAELVDDDERRPPHVRVTREPGHFQGVRFRLPLTAANSTEDE